MNRRVERPHLRQRAANAEIDDAILAIAQKNWRKVAMIVATVVHSRSEQAEADEYELVAGRIVALVKAGKLEAQGNLSDWRHSEVRLPA